jgi:hypothetical protein
MRTSRTEAFAEDNPAARESNGQSSVRLRAGCVTKKLTLLGSTPQALADRRHGRRPKRPCEAACRHPCEKRDESLEHTGEHEGVEGPREGRPLALGAGVRLNGVWVEEMIKDRLEYSV